MRRLVVVPALVALLGVACGGSSKSSTATTTTAPTPERALAQSLVLAAADFPAGYTTTPAASDDQAPEDQKIDDCTGQSGAAEDAARVNGPDATKDDSQISSIAEVKKTKEAFAKDAAAFTLERLQSCTSALKASFQDSSEDSPGTSIGDITVSALPIPTTFGDLTRGFRVVVQISSNEQTIPLYLDVVELGKDRAEVQLGFTNAGGPFDSATEQALIAKVGARLE